MDAEHTTPSDFHPRSFAAWPTVLCALAILSAILQTYTAVRSNTHLQAGDQGAYLDLALDQRDGVRFTDGNRHALYSALLVPFAERSPEFFMRARWVSFVLGLLFFGTLVWREWRSRQDIWALAFALLWLTHHVQMTRTHSEIWCEPLLYLLTYLLWSRSERLSKTGAAPGEVRGFSLDGFLAGLAYLTKGSGLQITALYWLTALVFRRRAMVGIGVGLGVFLVLCSPLFVWNSVQYGSPLYNFASTHNMWFDEADEIWFDDKSTLPTLGSYLKTHSASEIGSRALRGVWLETRMAGQILWSDWQFVEGAPAALQALFDFAKATAVVLVLFGFLPSRRSPPITSRSGAVYFGLLIAAFVLSFGWYAQLTDEPRFLMTLFPIAAVLLGRAASRGMDWLSDHGAVVFQSWIPRMLSAGWAVALGLALLTHGALAWRASELPGAVLTDLQGDALKALDGLPEGSRITHGPSHGLPVWLARSDLSFRPTPWRVEWPQFESMIRRESITHVLIDSETVARREYLQKLVLPSAAEEVGWKVVFRERGPEDFFILYEVSQ